MPNAKQMPNVAIVIPNWNGKNDLGECLDSLNKIKYDKSQVIVVDNGSTDGSQQYVKEKYPSVILIENKENEGFTGGNNVGIRYALKDGADYLILLNNDTVVEENIITAMLKTFEEKPDAGLVGPKVVYYSEPKNIWCAGCHYNKILGKGKMYGTHSKKRKSFDVVEQVDWISFCVVMIKAEVFHEIGFLDDTYFLSNEDMDFCIRAERKNFLCYYTPQTTVRHKIAQTLGDLDNPLYIYYQVRNTLLFYKKNRNVYGYVISLFYFLFLSLPKRIYVFFQNGYLERIKYMGYAVADFFKGRCGKGYYSTFIQKELQEQKTRKIRVGINARYLQRHRSGIERYIYELIVHLSQEKNAEEEKIKNGIGNREFEYVLFFNNHAPLPDLNLPLNFKIYISPFPTKNRLLRLIWEDFFLFYEIKEQKIDVFHGPSFFIPFSKPKNCKYVITVHDLAFLKYPKSFTFATRLYYKIFFSRSVALANTIIADSQSTKNDLIQYYHLDESKINVVYLGISEEFLKTHDKKYITTIKEKYNLPENYFLFTGVLSPRKNIETLLAAFEKIKKEKEYKAYKLLIMGRKGWLYENIFKKVNELGIKEDILFVEYVPEEELPVFYALAKIYLFPSLYEGFGLPILEAMACDCPVITSNISSMPEVAADAAILINPLNEAELIHAIKQVMQSKALQKQMREKGHMQVQKFSWKKTAQETKAIYGRLLEKKSGKNE